MTTIEDCLAFARRYDLADSVAISHLEDELGELRWKAARYDELPPALGYPEKDGPYAGLPTRCVNVLTRYGITTREDMAARIQQGGARWWECYRNVGPTVARRLEDWARG